MTIVFFLIYPQRERPLRLPRFLTTLQTGQPAAHRWPLFFFPRATCPIFLAAGLLRVNLGIFNFRLQVYSAKATCVPLN